MFDLSYGDIVRVSRDVTVRDSGGGFVNLNEGLSARVLFGLHEADTFLDHSTDDVQGAVCTVEVFCPDANEMNLDGGPHHLEGFEVPADALRLVHTE